MKRILLICNDSNTVINFRKELISFLQAKSYEVFVVAGDTKREEDIKKLDVEFFCIPFSNRDKNIASSLKLISSFKKIIKSIQPSVVFTFQIKPNIFGLRAAKRANIQNIFCMIEGLGDPFQPKNFKGKLLRILVSNLYRNSLRYAKKVFVLNQDDKQELIKRRIVNDSKLVVIPGIGIETSKYPVSYKNTSKKVIVNLSRLIINKGILEYCEIARKVRKVRPDIVFELYGSEGQLTKADISQYIEDGSIKYKGYINDVIPILSEATFIISTSYREGFSRVLLESMALGKPVIASNVIGNKELVIDGQTGFLCDLNDLNSFVKCILENIDDKEKLTILGKTARLVCESRYDSSIVNETLLEIIEKN